MDIPSQSSVGLPSFVRIKPGALDRIGIYAQRHHHHTVTLIVSAGIPKEIISTARQSLDENKIQIRSEIEADRASFETATTLFTELHPESRAIFGLGGGKALDVAKYVAFLARKPYYAVPTSLSNDGFCSPQSSLTVNQKRRSLPAALPFGVVVDTTVCGRAPRALWWSGVGDLVAKITAIRDWKLAYHDRGEPVNDLAALLSDASVFQFIANPTADDEGIRLLGTALMLNGIAMAISGSSRPASGAEHLISHALDARSSRPRLHGLQVGVASYLVSNLQHQGTARIARLFEQTQFWDAIRAEPFFKEEWLDAIRVGPAMNPSRYTILSTRDCTPEAAEIIENDPTLRGCFK